MVLHEATRLAQRNRAADGMRIPVVLLPPYHRPHQASDPCLRGNGRVAPASCRGRLVHMAVADACGAAERYPTPCGSALGTPVRWNPCAEGRGDAILASRASARICVWAYLKLLANPEYVHTAPARPLAPRTDVGGISAGGLRE